MENKIFLKSRNYFESTFKLVLRLSKFTFIYNRQHSFVLEKKNFENTNDITFSS